MQQNQDFPKLNTAVSLKSIGMIVEPILIMSEFHQSNLGVDARFSEGARPKHWRGKREKFCPFKSRVCREILMLVHHHPA